MLTRILSIGFLFATVWLAGCGSNETLDKQEAQRDDVLPELLGTWTSACQDHTIQRVIFTTDTATLEETSHFDPECQEKTRSVSHSGKFSLAHNFKEGIDNSIVFTADENVTVTLYTDYEVELNNSALSRIQNELESEIGISLSPGEKKNVARNNLKIRAAKAVTGWRRDEAKALNRLALEKLASAGLLAQPYAEQHSRIAIRYEMDNGYLQVFGPQPFGRVYSK